MGGHNQNYRDMRDAARRVVDHVETAVESNVTGKPVVVLMGEIHNQPSHVFFQQLVLREAQDRSLDFTVSMENAHNILGDYIKSDLRMDAPKDVIDNPSSYDTAGDMVLLASLASLMPNHAPRTHRNLLAFCLRNNLKTIFSDAVTDGKYVDMGDVVTARYARAAGVDMQKKHNALSPDMMLLRNRMMIDFSLAHAGHVRKDLIILLSGAYHVAGSKGVPSLHLKASYETSLHALMSQKGITAIPVLPRMPLFTTGLPEASIDWLDYPFLWCTSGEKQELQALYDANGRICRFMTRIA